MDRAIVGVCFDARQRRILQVAFPSWERYARRYGLPLIVVERDYADGDYYWNKHLLFRNPGLQSFKYLMFLDNDVFINQGAGPLLNDWDSPLIGATTESTQAGWSREVISRYYDDYLVERTNEVSNLEVINTGVLVIPREQSDFLESVYRRWKSRMTRLPRRTPKRTDPFALAADQPHISYELQVQHRYARFSESFNTLWWHWYPRNVSPRRLPFLLQSKAAALLFGPLPGTVWQVLFRRARMTFARALAACDFLHVAGSKSPVFLGAEPRPRPNEYRTDDN